MGPFRASIFLLLFCSAALAEYCPENFASIKPASPEQRVFALLGYLPELRHHSVLGLKEEIGLFDRKGMRIGYFQYQMVGRRLMVKSVNVRKENQRKGLSEYLFSRVLKKQPEIDSVATELADDNATLFYKARSKGLGCEDAIRKTPAYLMRARFGFTTLLSVDCGETSEDKLGFVVGR